ncbi:MAG: PIN domain-containing protein [Eggerthellaceae bacterium]|nr:PIN domain-containing protein [Eggerthellaceae bacterium]
MKLLLDTNVLVDYFGRRKPYLQDWLTLLVIQDFGDIELWVSAKSFTDVFCLLQKEVGGNRLQQMFLESFQFLRVCSIGAVDFEEATKAAWDDFEDCLVAVAAKKVGADFIITRDLVGFSKASVPALSGQQFITWLEQEKGLTYEPLEL